MPSLAFAFSSKRVFCSSEKTSSNDPTTPLQSLSVSATNTGSAIGIGEVALDFTLTDLDGTSHTLSQQLGNPVVLAYFATW